MQRHLETAEEIHAEVSRLIHDSEVVRDDGEELHVPRPQAQPPGVEANGCSWSMRSFGNASAYQSIVAHALATVQAKWNLNS